MNGQSCGRREFRAGWAATGAMSPLGRGDTHPSADEGQHDALVQGQRLPLLHLDALLVQTLHGVPGGERWSGRTLGKMSAQDKQDPPQGTERGSSRQGGGHMGEQHEGDEGARKGVLTQDPGAGPLTTSRPSLQCPGWPRAHILPVSAFRHP